jgi:hypothetical protein
VREGGPIGYGTNLGETYRQAGNYAGRILKGEKPSFAEFGRYRRIAGIEGPSEQLPITPAPFTRRLPRPRKSLFCHS